MAFRFLHSADLHIGKPFGNLPEDLRGRLREARHGLIARLAERARSGGAGTILLAGDSFDTETPSPAILRQALAAIGQEADIRWIILPGNHDSLQAEELWRRIGEAAPPNLHLATSPHPFTLAPGVTLLPAPGTTRRPGRDLTEWMDGAETPDGALRIGLAHGPVLDFSESGTAASVIAPDRARRAGLDYLALGDWHGPMALDLRTRYPGTPEPDRFKHDAPGTALLVTIEGPGAPPEITAVPTAQFSWTSIGFDPLLEGSDPDALLSRLPQPAFRRTALVRLVLSGHLSLGQRNGLVAALDVVAPEFALFETDETGLSIACEPGDLDRIDRAGALREAAQTLLAESEDPLLSLAERETSRAALVRLFTLAERAGA
ncbi:DNA repair exonuclease [Arsenicitalea aurantiaca]|uniref:DNA repair exonuclease n=1 Tax=Arsenicitalea aurantiaca TaxID=1783274 RepID=A0A433XKY8_9HYPH|nr:DNA repair exonuclease [Arsenicitalea aurantiaca]RUT34750.1 DNA repair exonuclease [Arsenicitalea aurantiaca]